MSNESWTVYTIKFIGWIALRAAADYMKSGLRNALNFVEVVKNFYHGDIVHGAKRIVLIAESQNATLQLKNTEEMVDGVDEEWCPRCRHGVGLTWSHLFCPFLGPCVQATKNYPRPLSSRSGSVTGRWQ